MVSPERESLIGQWQEIECVSCYKSIGLARYMIVNNELMGGSLRAIVGEDRLGLPLTPQAAYSG